MKEYHRVWLSVHPERSADWLQDRLKDGFDIHHLDGDHGNNDPLNLVLIEGADHLMLHNGSARCSRIVPNLQRANQTPEALERAKQAYEGYDSNAGWGVVAEALGLGYWSGQQARTMAKRHAAANALTWPIVPQPKVKKFRPRPLGHNIPANVQR